MGASFFGAVLQDFSFLHWLFSRMRRVIWPWPNWPVLPFLNEYKEIQIHLQSISLNVTDEMVVPSCEKKALLAI